MSRKFVNNYCRFFDCNIYVFYNVPSKSTNSFNIALATFFLENSLYPCHMICYSRHDVTPITMALNNASGYPQACQALTSMLTRNTLNPADITVLFRIYSAVDPPPIDLIRIPQLLGNNVLFIPTIFTLKFHFRAVSRFAV